MKIVIQFLNKKSLHVAWVIVVLMFSMTQAYSYSASSRSSKVNDDRVELIHADNLRYDEALYPGAQRVSGKVEIRHKGMILKCDSAVLYQHTNSFEAMGHVRMTQGDTLSLTSDSVYYDGQEQIAKARRKVVLTHRGHVLTADSLNYDRLYKKGYYFECGTLRDGKNVLTSDWGEYYTTTRKANFYYSVKLVNKKFTLTTDTLAYDTRTKLAHVLGPSNIVSGQSRVYTTDAYYNSQTEEVQLYHSSQLYSKNRNMSGDSIFYDKKKGIMEAFRDVCFEDPDNNVNLFGDYCWYNEYTGEAYAYGRALAKDYSNPKDTLFVHSDTIRMYTYNKDTDSLYRVVHGYRNARAYRSDIQAVCDSLVGNSQLKRLDMYYDPIVWSGNRQILGEEINVFSNDSTLDSVRVERQALMVEKIDSVHYNQVAGQLMRAYFDENKQIKENRVDGNVYVIFYPIEQDSVMLYQNYTETTQMRMFMKDGKLKRLWTNAAKGFLYPIGLAPADQTYLKNFAWFDYIRPRDKYDLFEWRGKKAGTELKESVRREAPVQKLKSRKKKKRHE